METGIFQKFLILRLSSTVENNDLYQNYHTCSYMFENFLETNIPNTLLKFTRQLIDSVPTESCKLATTLVLVLLQECPTAMPEEFATTIITELAHLKHVENPEIVAELLQGSYRTK